MSVRKQTANRRSLIRVCGTCGKTFSTTADSPWMRQMPRDGKKQAITYFCCSDCYKSSYKNIGWYDGKADIRRQKRESNRDRTEYNHKYYEKNREEIKRKHRKRYWENHEESLLINKYSKKKRKMLEKGEDN